MTNRIPTTKEARLIRQTFYVPIVAFGTLLFSTGSIRGNAVPMAVFFLLFLAVITFIVAKKLEVSRKMVIPTSQDVLAYCGLSIFIVSCKVGARILFHKEDWLEDLLHWVVIFLAFSPWFLCFRKFVPEEMPNP
jgi:hypothetical protein